MEQLDISDRAASLTVSSVHGGAGEYCLVLDGFNFFLWRLFVGFIATLVHNANIIICSFIICIDIQ